MTDTIDATRLREALLRAENDDPEALRPLLAPAVVWHTPGHNLLGGDHMGQEQVLTLLREYKAFTSGSYHVEPRGSKSAAIILHATASRGADKLEADEEIRYRVEDGKVAELWTTTRDAGAWDKFWSPRVPT